MTDLERLWYQVCQVMLVVLACCAVVLALTGSWVLVVLMWRAM